MPHSLWLTLLILMLSTPVCHGGESVAKALFWSDMAKRTVATSNYDATKSAFSQRRRLEITPSSALQLWIKSFVEDDLLKFYISNPNNKSLSTLVTGGAPQILYSAEQIGNRIPAGVTVMGVGEGDLTQHLFWVDISSETGVASLESSQDDEIISVPVNNCSFAEGIDFFNNNQDSLWVTCKDHLAVFNFPAGGNHSQMTLTTVHLDPPVKQLRSVGVHRTTGDVYVVDADENSISYFEMEEYTDGEITRPRTVIFESSDKDAYALGDLAIDETNSRILVSNTKSCNSASCNAILELPSARDTTTTTTASTTTSTTTTTASTTTTTTTTTKTDQNRRLGDANIQHTIPTVVISRTMDTSMQFSAPFGVDINADKQKLVWSDQLDGKIRSVPLASPTSTPTVEGTSGMSIPRALSVVSVADPPTFLVTDYGKTTVSKLTVGQSLKSEDLVTASSEPHGAVYIPEENFAVFSLPVESKLQKISLADNKVSDFVTGKKITNLAYDKLSRRVLGSSPENQRVYSWALDGSDEKVRYNMGEDPHGPDYIAADSAGVLYVSTGKDGNIRYVPITLKSGEEAPVFYSSVNDTAVVRGLAVDTTHLVFIVDDSPTTSILSKKLDDRDPKGSIQALKVGMTEEFFPYSIASTVYWPSSSGGSGLSGSKIFGICLLVLLCIGVSVLAFCLLCKQKARRVAFCLVCKKPPEHDLSGVPLGVAYARQDDDDVGPETYGRAYT